MNYLYPDLHMHSNVSDGSDSPLELLSKVREEGIDIFSLTDHDTFNGCRLIQNNLKAGDPLFIWGIELSCRDEFGKYHILGYCYDENKSSIQGAAEITHNARIEKVLNRFSFLENEYNISFTDEEKKVLLQNENPGKPHFVSLLLKKGIINTKEEGFALLGKYHGKERRLTPQEAIDAILESDGIPVLAHGIFGDGSQLLSEDDLNSRIQRLKRFGMMGLECYYSSYSEEQNKMMLSLAKTNNMLVTAGSDYHGKNKSVKIGERGNPDPEIMQSFYHAIHLLLGL